MSCLILNKIEMQYMSINKMTIKLDNSLRKGIEKELNLIHLEKGQESLETII